MVTRVIAREARLAAALEGMRQARSRAHAIPATLTERQRRDHRTKRRSSADPATVLGAVAAISRGEGASGADRAGDGFYGGGGDFGGGVIVRPELEI